jgi:raffinose/stachyose/melibiose transport system substrate-binding protein
MTSMFSRRIVLAAATTAAMALALASPSFAETVLTISSDSNEETTKALDALTKAYTAANPDVKFELETRPGGAEGDNLVKTRLATGEMTDIFQYNSGSLFQALNPTQSLADLSDIQADVIESYNAVVMSTDGKIRGVPFGAAMGGGIYYNKKIYAELGLSVPKTWADFMANNEKIKAAGKVAVAQTYKDTWSSQLFVLADYFNVQAANPTFAADYTANKAKYATTPAAQKGFDYLAAVNKAGYLNADYGAATFDDGVRMVANGDAAHYPMLTFAIGNIKQNFPDKLNDVGFFAQPGDDAAKNGLTVWMPSGLYLSSKSDKQDAAKKFLKFVASPDGCKIMVDTNGATGPYLIKNCALPADVPPSVADMMPYFQAGLTAPALEFLSPIKGPNLEQLTVEVGSGIRPAADAAALYDKDVEKQAKQLGLPGW